MIIPLEQSEGNAIFKPGHFKIYAGAMFTDKTDQFVRDFRRTSFSRVTEYKVFKPSIDDRFGTGIVKSRNGGVIECIPLPSDHPEYLLDYLTKDTKVIGLDEAQFFSRQIVDVVQELRLSKRHVIATMLDQDFRGEPFGVAPHLMAIADEVQKTYGLCSYNEFTRPYPGTKTQRLINKNPAYYDDPVVLIEHEDRKEQYELRCIYHHDVPRRT